MIIYPVKKIQFLFVLLIYIFRPLPPIDAFESGDYLTIQRLVKSCYYNINSCNESLFKINNYQQRAAKNNMLSCQTRLLGLEAHLIMAMNSNLKKNEAKSIIDAMKRYC